MPTGRRAHESSPGNSLIDSLYEANPGRPQRLGRHRDHGAVDALFLNSAAGAIPDPTPAAGPYPTRVIDTYDDSADVDDTWPDIVIGVRQPRPATSHRNTGNLGMSLTTGGRRRAR